MFSRRCVALSWVGSLSGVCACSPRGPGVSFQSRVMNERTSVVMDTNFIREYGTLKRAQIEKKMLLFKATFVITT